MQQEDVTEAAHLVVARKQGYNRKRPGPDVPFKGMPPVLTSSSQTPPSTVPPSPKLVCSHFESV
jgi:hypothetical protein